MKALYFLIPLFMVQACKTQTGTTSGSTTNTMEHQENTPAPCPNEGTCTVTVHENKSLRLKEDTTGQLYPQLVDGQGMVVEYTYLKEGPEGTVDGNYSETIQFEVPANGKALNLENAQLKEVNLLYGKHCFCRGEAGYYPVTDGKLQLKKDGNSLSFHLSFTVGKTSQVISRIEETVAF